MAGIWEVVPLGNNITFKEKCPVGDLLNRPVGKTMKLQGLILAKAVDRTIVEKYSSPFHDSV